MNKIDKIEKLISKRNYYKEQIDTFKLSPLFCIRKSDSYYGEFSYPLDDDISQILELTCINFYKDKLKEVESNIEKLCQEQ